MEFGPWESAGEAIARRKFLATGITTAAAVGVLGPVFVADRAASAGHNLFAHGVASGDPLPDAIVVWTRVTPDPQARPGSGRGEPTPITWELAVGADFSDVVARGAMTTHPDLDHTVKVDVTGLAAGTTYFYRFRRTGSLADGQVSPTGRTRTAPAAGDELESLRLGVVSCSNWQAGYFSAYRHVRDADVDVVLHLGDYIYEYEPGFYSYGHDFTDVRRHDPPHETVTLADYRRRHAQYKTDPDLQRLHADVPFITTWDDHEIADGWWSGGAFEHDPRTEGSWIARREAAKRAYDEWMPIRISGTAAVGDGTRVYRSFGFGELADLAMLDLRGYRDERIRSDAAVQRHPERTITGRRQHAWLVDRLTGSNAQWKLVGNPVMIAPALMPQRPQPEQLAVMDATDPMSWGDPEANTDTWDGYPADRRRLLAEVAEVDNVVFLSGDVHTSWANEIPGDSGAAQAVEFVCPSITSNNVDDYMGTRPRTVSLAMEAAIVDLNPHVKFVNLDDHGYCLLELTPERMRMDWYAISDRRDPAAGTRLLTSRTVQAGSPAVLPT